MDEKLQKHFEEEEVDPTSALGRFLETLYNVRKSVALRLMAEEREKAKQGESA